MNFGGDHSAHGLQFCQVPRGRRSCVPRWPRAPSPRGPRGGIATEDARCSERLTGSRRARRPQPGNVGVEGRVSDRPTVWRMPPWHPPSARQDENRAPERQPSRASDFGMLTEPSTKFPWHYPSQVPYSQSISRAERRVLRALPRPSSRRTPGRKPGPESLTEPNSEFSRQKIANSVQPWSELAILRSPKAKTHDYLRYRKARTRTTGRNVRFPLPRPRKTVCFGRQRPKQTVFRIAHPQGEGAGPERGGAAPGGRRGARAKVVAPGARAVAPRARARRRARRAYANDTEPSTASSTCWNR